MNTGSIPVNTSIGFQPVKYPSEAIKLESATQNKTTELGVVTLIEKVDSPSTNQPSNLERSIIPAKKNCKREREIKKADSLNQKKIHKKRKLDKPISDVKKEQENKPENLSEVGTEIEEFSLLNYPEEIICLIAEKLDVKTLAAFDQTCTSLRGLVDHTWGIFRKRDGLNFEFGRGQGKKNSEKYLLSYSVRQNLTQQFKDTLVNKVFAEKFPDIYTILKINSLGHASKGFGAIASKIYSYIKESAEKFPGDSLLYAQITPLERHEEEILEHYINASNHGILGVSALAWDKFSALYSESNEDALIPEKLENLIISSAQQDNYQTLFKLLKAKKVDTNGMREEGVRLCEAAAGYSNNPFMSVTLRKLLAMCYVSSNDFPKAALYFNAIDLAQLNHQQLKFAAKANFQVGNFSRAAELLESFIQKYQEQNIPVSSKDLWSVLVINIKANNFGRALQIFDLYFKACEIESIPIKTNDLKIAATLNYQEQNFQRAVQLYEILIQRYHEAGEPVEKEILEKFNEASIRAKNS